MVPTERIVEEVPDLGLAVERWVPASQRESELLLTVAVELRKHDDGWHWWVNGRDKGQFARDENRKIYRISLLT